VCTACGGWLAGAPARALCCVVEAVLRGLNLQREWWPLKKWRLCPFGLQLSS
jgi:hypothetical protein